MDHRNNYTGGDPSDSVWRGNVQNVLWGRKEKECKCEKEEMIMGLMKRIMMEEMEKEQRIKEKMYPVACIRCGEHEEMELDGLCVNCMEEFREKVVKD